MAENDSRLIVTFENHPMLNEARSREEGRPIFEDLEVCRIRMSGDRLQSPVFPAHAEAPGGYEDPETGLTRPVTYAEKYASQYKKFKAGEQQTKEGTPIEALPFLTPAKVKELKGVNVYTAEALADLDGQPLKTLGQGGREWKTQARAYLDNAAGSAQSIKQAQEIEFLREEIERLKKENVAKADAERVSSNLGYDDGEKPIESMTDEELRQFIATKTGAKPHGKCSRETLLGMAQEAASEKK